MVKPPNITSYDGKRPNTPDKTSSDKRRSWLKWLLWIFVILILGLIIIAALLWSNRYSLLEDLAIDSFAEQGITAALTIDNIGETEAQLSDITLTHDGEVFFKAGRIWADYNWREALEGQFGAVTIDQARAHVTLDARGKLIDGWLPPGFSEQNDADEPKTSALPKRGLTISNSVVFVKSPYGSAEVKTDVKFQSPENFTADLSVSESQFQHGELTLTGGGDFNIVMNADAPSVDAKAVITKLSHPAMDANGITLNLNGRPNMEGKSFDGQAQVSLQNLDTAQAFIGQSEIKWDGQIAQNASEKIDASGNWSAVLKQARIPDPVRAADLATTLSFYEPLRKSPIAQNFVPELRQTLNSLFSGSDVKARGHLTRNAGGTVLSLSQPATIKSLQTTLTLTPKSNAAAYKFDRDAQRIFAALDANFTQPAGLNLTDLDFKARSINGVRLGGVEAFSANVQTQQTWDGYGEDGRPVRLSPLKLAMHYDGKTPNKRAVAMTGTVDYDGILPGGYVEGLRAQGDMRLTLNESGDMQLGFTPKDGTRLRIDRLETTSDWSVLNIDADITPSPSLFNRLPAPKNASRNQASFDVSNITAQLQRGEDAATLDVSAKSLTAKGHLNRDEINGPLTQNWDMAFTQTLITSDDLPGPDTEITMDEGQIEARLVTGQTPYFDLTTPAANINTQLVKADNMRLRMRGTTQSYDIEHDGGRVKLEGNELPPIPIEGQLTVKGGSFIGDAKARLPQADNTPIALSYNIHDGTGFVDVTIDELRFTPNGLQPQNLISALRGKIAQVDGAASAQIRLELARDQPLKSSGTAKIINMNFGTAPGPLTGMNMELTMDSVLPLISRGRQRITVAEFDPGMPLLDGEIEFELVDDGVKIYSARWPLGAGFFSLDPFTWKYGADENRLIMRLSDVELSEFIENLGNDSIEATGILQGEFPILISGINLTVEKGTLFVKDGGTIRYTPAAIETEPPVSYTQEEAIKILRTKDTARYSSLARDALREFKYRELYVNIDGSLDGEVELGTVFSGSNPKVLNGQPFEFDINVVGELFNIMRSFNSNAQIKSQLEKQGISTDGLAIGP